MKQLKIEYTAFDYKDFVPNNSFFRELSRQITPKIVTLITDNTLHDVLADLICLSVYPDSYISPAFQDGRNFMLMDISSKSSSLIIGKVIVSWYVPSKCKIYPWDDFHNEIITFELFAPDSEIKAINSILPKLYHPVIKSSVSGLPYDYQIYYGGKALVITTSTPIISGYIEAITEAFKHFINKLDSPHIIESDSYSIKTYGKTLIKIHVDSNVCDTEVVESMIRCFSSMDFIKKIVFR